MPPNEPKGGKRRYRVKQKRDFIAERIYSVFKHQLLFRSNNIVFVKAVVLEDEGGRFPNAPQFVR